MLDSSFRKGLDLDSLSKVTNGKNRVLRSLFLILVALWKEFSSAVAAARYPTVPDTLKRPEGVSGTRGLFLNEFPLSGEELARLKAERDAYPQRNEFEDDALRLGKKLREREVAYLEQRQRENLADLHERRYYAHVINERALADRIDEAHANDAEPHSSGGCWCGSTTCVPGSTRVIPGLRAYANDAERPACLVKNDFCDRIPVRCDWCPVGAPNLEEGK